MTAGADHFALSNLYSNQIDLIPGGYHLRNAANLAPVNVVKIHRYRRPLLTAIRTRASFILVDKFSSRSPHFNVPRASLVFVFRVVLTTPLLKSLEVFSGVLTSTLSTDSAATHDALTISVSCESAWLSQLLTLRAPHPYGVAPPKRQTITNARTSRWPAARLRFLVGRRPVRLREPPAGLLSLQQTVLGPRPLVGPVPDRARLGATRPTRAHLRRLEGNKTDRAASRGSHDSKCRRVTVLKRGAPDGRLGSTSPRSTSNETGIISGFEILLITGGGLEVGIILGSEILLITRRTRKVWIIVGFEILLINGGVRDVQIIPGSEIMLITDRAREVQIILGSEILLINGEGRRPRSFQVTKFQTEHAGCRFDALTERVSYSSIQLPNNLGGGVSGQNGFSSIIPMCC